MSAESLNEVERATGRTGVAAARRRLAITRDGGMYRCCCGAYENVSLTAVELHRTRDCKKGNP